MESGLAVMGMQELLSVPTNGYRHPGEACKPPTLHEGAEIIETLLKRLESLNIRFSKQMTEKAENFAKRVRIANEPRVEVMTGHAPRGNGGIYCFCSGYATRVACTEEEIKRYGNCMGGGECCARAFLCAVCGIRWVGTAEAPEMGES
jgi:hypothetical protein